MSDTIIQTGVDIFTDPACPACTRLAAALDAAQNALVEHAIPAHAERIRSFMARAPDSVAAALNLQAALTAENPQADAAPTTAPGTVSS